MREYIDPPQPIDEVGNRYGSLIVMERVKPKLYIKRARKGAIWLCLCDCGNKVEVPGTLLRRGFVKLCEQCANDTEWWENV